MINLEIGNLVYSDVPDEWLEGNYVLQVNLMQRNTERLNENWNSQKEEAGRVLARAEMEEQLAYLKLKVAIITTLTLNRLWFAAALTMQMI